MTEKKVGEVLKHQLACEKEDDCVCGGYCEECLHNISDEDWIAALNVAISAVEKQEAIKSCTPPSDDWEHYADRLHDIAYQSGYEQGKKDTEQDRWISVTEKGELDGNI